MNMKSPERNNSTQRFKATIVAVGVAAAIFGINAGAASAGTYSVPQCHGGFGAGLSPQWSTAINGSWAASNICPSGLQVAGHGFTGNFTTWMMIPPAGLTIDSVTFGGQGNGATSSVPLLALLCNSQAAPICGWQDAEDMNVAPSQHTLTAPGSSSFNFTMGSSCCAAPASSAYASIWNIVFTMNDAVSPNVGSPAGTIKTTPGNNWNSGVVTGGITGSDGQSGVQSLLATIDANPVGPASVSNNLSCSSIQIVPCPSSPGAWSPSIGTSLLADGPHTLRYSASDYASNSAQSALYNFKSDNTRPETPASIAAQTSGQGGWNSANSFAADWTNGVETVEAATRSGIEAVIVDVQPTSGSQANPAPITVPIGTTVGGVTASMSAISGLNVPAAGAWTLRLQLRDRAGNLSAVGDGSGSSADSDISIGFDPTLPANGAANSNGWISRLELASGYDQEWNPPSVGASSAPICGYAGKVSLNPVDNPGTTINIPGNVTSWELPSNLPEATNYVHLRSVNCAYSAAPTVEMVEAKVDLTDPVAFFSGVEDGHWYQNGKTATFGGTDALSGMTGSIAGEAYDLGAYIDYEINAAPQTPVKGGTATVPFTGEGQKEVRFAPVDLAGNRAQTKIVKFGIDATNPEGYFDLQDPSKPTLIRAPLADPVSGLETASIEIRPQAGGAWSLLPTALADYNGAAVGGFPKNAIASARFPDTALPGGNYLARVTTVDQAGNFLTTDKDKNGNALILANPMRAYAGLSATLFKAKRTCKKKKGVRCIKKMLGKVVFLGGKDNLTVGYKRGAVVQGFLVGEKNTPLGRQPIEIYTQQKGKPEILAGTTATKTDGSYAFKLRPGVSRSVRVFYPGTETRRETSASVTLGTGAKLKLRVSDRTAKTGQTVTFKGTVTSLDKAVPASGKIIALQFYAGKKWRPAVAIARTDSKGRFSVKYKFDGKGVKARIVFRVIAPSEDGWGHATSASRRITLKLN